MPTTEEIQLMQQQAVEATQPYTDLMQVSQTEQSVDAFNALLANQTVVNAGSLGAMNGVIFFLSILIFVVMIIMTIVGLINTYHWGMTDKAIFDAVKENKKKWFYILIATPFACTFVGIIPLIGWPISLIGFVFWIVMSLKYFFSMKKKLKQPK